MVEAFRAGTILGQDAKQYQRWRRSLDRHYGHRPQGKNLAQLARDFGGNIVAGDFEFRN